MTTDSSKPVKKRSKKKIINKSDIDLYALNATVKNKEAALKILQNSRKEIETSISELVNDYNMKTALSTDAGKFLEKLPLDSLKDLYDFSNGKRGTSSLSILRSKSKIRKDQGKKLQDLSDINRQISENEIDLLLAKIDHLISKPGN